jgi:hypothetical protein
MISLLCHGPNRKAHIWFLADQDMKMIRHVIDCYQLLALRRADAGYVFFKLIVMLLPDWALRSFEPRRQSGRRSAYTCSPFYAAPTELIVFW